MHKFDTKVQHLKYKVLKEVARLSWEDKLLENLLNIPTTIVPGKEPTMRCCVYKERAILGERVKIAMGGDRENSNVIEIIEIACDECPVGGFEVTNACRGCLAHRCEDACRFGAISFDHHHVAHIDKSKCKECGACAKVCPYTAIISRKRPCQNACKLKAISMNEEKAAKIDDSKCIQCGACVYQCPFGAIMDKSYIIDAVKLLKNSQTNSKENGVPTYAIVAPSIASQFSYAKLGQVYSGLYELGFDNILEVSLGADIVALKEAKELAEKGFLTSSCCPAFVEYVETNFPNLLKHVSTNLSPMAELAKLVKEKTPNCKVIFIGPCTAKKQEMKKDSVKPYVDVVLTFEELQALFDSREIELNSLEEREIENSSSFGRIFARSGGLTEAVTNAIKEQNIDFQVKPVVCDGIEACRVALLKLNKGMLDGNFIEGMACIGGCIGGAGCLTHGEKSKIEIDKYGKQSNTNLMANSIEKI